MQPDNNNDYSVLGFLDSDDDESSIFSDAVEEGGACYARTSNGSGSGLPEEVRKEILELGLPDDGYNYLMHLREIRNEGGGSAYYENSRARIDLVPLDVSRVRLSIDAVKDEEPGVDTIYKVASKSALVRVQKAIDPDVTRLLDDSDLSRFGSDVDDLEEDFVLMANQPDGEEHENEDVQVRNSGADEEVVYERESDSEVDDGVQQRVRRPLDDAFDEVIDCFLI